MDNPLIIIPACIVILVLIVMVSEWFPADGMTRDERKESRKLIEESYRRITIGTEATPMGNRTEDE